MNPPTQLQILCGDRRQSSERPAPDAEGSLAQWLAQRGFPLNTRCGGRGLCRGCRVETTAGSLRACQMKACELDTDTRQLTIPESSLHDETLDGVSAFEVGLSDIRYRRRAGVGLALDIGTTTVAATLWDLQDGRLLAEGTAANAQRQHGDNVLARIEYALQSAEAPRALHEILVHQTLRPLLERVCKEAGLPIESITEGVATGNTVMLHTLLDAALDGFAKYPFNAQFLEHQQVDAGDLGLGASFPLHTAPNLGPFVGGDITAGALASGMLEQDGPALLIDFGTNGEILLKTPDGYLATATAAGPAFEGGRLNCGQPAAPGVIGSLSLQADQWIVHRIGGARQKARRGMSGAAYIDFLAHGRAGGWLDSMGHFDRSHPRIKEGRVDGEAVFIAEIEGSVFVSEHDIAELMQAKAAILGGVHTLLEEAGIEASQLETLYIAGGFGYHLNPEHSMAVGLTPRIPKERVRIIGNASLAGASLLLQAETDHALEQLVQHCRVIELNQIDSFEDHYIDAMSLDDVHS